MLNQRSLSTTSLFILLIISLVTTLLFGAYQLSIAEIWEAVILKSQGSSNLNSFLILNIRLPRILTAGIVGAGLAISGAAIQGLFRNPLADPSLIGVTSGAMLFAVLSIVLLSTILTPFAEVFQQASIMVFAFLGGLLTTYVVYFLSKRNGKTVVLTMLLAGIAITALAGAITGFFIYSSNNQQLRDITFWSLGSFSGASWTQVLIAAPIILTSIFILQKYAKALNAILLGEKEAVYLGFEVEKIKPKIIFITALIVGISIAISGIVGFVGLVIPHFLRLIFGSDYRHLMRNSALLGALFLIVTDTLARTIIAPAELPIGILTAIIGAPFFLWLLMRTKVF